MHASVAATNSYYSYFCAASDFFAFGNKEKSHGAKFGENGAEAAAVCIPICKEGLSSVVTEQFLFWQFAGLTARAILSGVGKTL